MATINVKATVSAPSEINIPLVRADLYATSNVFRIFFEAFLAFFSGILGAVLTMAEIPAIYWIVLVISGVCALVFGGCAFYFGRSSKHAS